MTYPARGWRKAVFRWPLLLWRLGLARWHPANFLVLTTTGRKSGKPRHTMLEHSRMGDTVYLSSGWGRRTQWYKNICADSLVTVKTTKGEVFFGRVSSVEDDAELAALFEQMQGNSPVWDAYLESWGIEDKAEDFVAKKDRLCVLRVDPSDQPGPPSMASDLVWVWGPVGIALAASFWAFCG